MKYIYADLVNGCAEIKKNDVPLEPIACSDIDDARKELDDLEENEFEVVLEVDSKTFDIINEEYGIH